jgi:hypothetical protein
MFTRRSDGVTGRQLPGSALAWRGGVLGERAASRHGAPVSVQLRLTRQAPFRSRPQIAPSVRGAETDADLGVLVSPGGPRAREPPGDGSSSPHPGWPPASRRHPHHVLLSSGRHHSERRTLRSRFRFRQRCRRAACSGRPAISSCTSHRIGSSAFLAVVVPSGSLDLRPCAATTKRAPRSGQGKKTRDTPRINAAYREFRLTRRRY